MSSLSAYLASTTGNNAYTDAAILSANFIKTTNMSSGDLVLETIDAQDCTRSLSSWLLTTPASVSKLDFTVVAASTKVPTWESSDGIITETPTS
ncbi:hypothetical protein F4604DRAFT_1924679 [Suillus subluteus]|nr:hypothetical protein F4604DRAFT_1924679 [Suillus subluteus]